MSDSNEDWKRVGELVEMRRGELGYLNQQEAADKAQIGITKWREIEGGKSGKPVMLGAVAGALGWPADALQRIARGDESFIEPQALEVRVDTIEGELGQIRQTLVNVERLLLQEGD